MNSHLCEICVKEKVEYRVIGEMYFLYICKNCAMFAKLKGQHAMKHIIKMENTDSISYVSKEGLKEMLKEYSKA